jgi:nucleotide-binding universal stress UspA family protein
MEAFEGFPFGIQTGFTDVNMDELCDRVTKESMKRMNRLPKAAEKRQIEINFKVLWGKPWLEIIREVIRGRHDLVILVPKRKPKYQEILFGSRIMHLMRKCPCPVWALKPTRQKKYHRVMAAIDPSPADSQSDALNLKILELAVASAHRDNSELHIFHCWRSPHEKLIRTRSLLSQEEIKNLTNETRKALKDKIEDLLAKIDMGDLSYKLFLRKGEPEGLIPSHVLKRRIDLVVMGTVVRTGLTGFLIGNTAERVLSSINCSVLAVKPDGFETPVSLA